MPQRIVVAIDGPAGAGKSTIARSVADRLGFIYVDTGAMYRSVALWALRSEVPETDMFRLERLASDADIQFETGNRRVLLNGEDVTDAIRDGSVSIAASKVAAIPAVRRELVRKQRLLSEAHGVVMEGRDIGSIVFPNATVKIFLDAPAHVRSSRRTQELRQRGEEVDDARTAREMSDRDTRDRTRVESPLVQAPGAIYLDSGSLSIDEVVDAVLTLVRDRTPAKKEPES